ncbi:DUF2062 domain-containing protein [Flammeovirgaceae bacterium SG7u.132]|nr:DUF2062 domain-containing protein [Flammeovirgaceae bacterium SG7u.132]
MNIKGIHRISSNKGIQAIIGFLRQGISPKKLALSVAIGIALGFFPFLGLTTVFSALAAITLRLNMPTIQLVNYLMYPIQIALYIPLISLGDFMFDAAPFPFTLGQIFEQLEKDLFGTINTLWLANLRGILAWLIFSFPVGFSAYHISLFLFKKALPKTNSDTEPPLSTASSLAA